MCSCEIIFLGAAGGLSAWAGIRTIQILIDYIRQRRINNGDSNGGPQG